MKPKRVLIGSFILMILGLFFIVGTDQGITGAAIGVSTSALDSASSPLFGFFLIWIACFMLIVTTGGKITLKTLIDVDDRARKFAKEQEYKVARDYVKTVESFEKDGKPKSYEDLNQEELKAVMENVQQGMALRYFLTYSKKTASEFSEAIKSGDDTQIDRIKGWYIRDSGIKGEDIQKVAKQGASISSLLELSKTAGKGIIETENELYKNRIDYSDTKKIIEGINKGYKDSKVGIYYNAKEFEEEIKLGKLERLMTMIDQYKQDKFSSKVRSDLSGKKPKR